MFSPDKRPRRQAQVEQPSSIEKKFKQIGKQFINFFVDTESPDYDQQLQGSAREEPEPKMQ